MYNIFQNRIIEQLGIKESEHTFDEILQQLQTAYNIYKNDLIKDMPDESYIKDMQEQLNKNFNECKEQGSQIRVRDKKPTRGNWFRSFINHTERKP